MNGTMHRRDIEVEKRMMDLMTTVQDSTLGVKDVVVATLSRPSPVPVALNPANAPSASAFSTTQQPTYQETVQRHSGTPRTS